MNGIGDNRRGGQIIHGGHTHNDHVVLVGGIRLVPVLLRMKSLDSFSVMIRIAIVHHRDRNDA